MNDKLSQLDFAIEYYEFLKSRNAVTASQEFCNKLDKIAVINDIDKDVSDFLKFFLKLSTSLDEKSFNNFSTKLFNLGKDSLIHKVRVDER